MKSEGIIFRKTMEKINIIGENLLKKYSKIGVLIFQIEMIYEVKISVPSKSIPKLGIPKSGFYCSSTTQNQKNSNLQFCIVFISFLFGAFMAGKSYLQWNNTILLDGCFLGPFCVTRVNIFPFFLGRLSCKNISYFHQHRPPERNRISLKQHRSGNLETLFRFSLKSRTSDRFKILEDSQNKAEIALPVLVCCICKNLNCKDTQGFLIFRT